jgi:hypothetical protein
MHIMECAAYSIIYLADDEYQFSSLKNGTERVPFGIL